MIDTATPQDWMQALRDALAGEDCVLYEGELLDSYTSMGVGGPCPVMLCPRTPEALAAAARWLSSQERMFRILGGGTNLLIDDAGVPEPVISLRELNPVLSLDGTALRASASVRLPRLAQAAAEAGLAGLEFASGIPGTVGGAAVMNAGAFDCETSDVIVFVNVVTARGERKKIMLEDLDYGYRHSSLQKSTDMVIEAVFNLKPGGRETILLKMREIQTRRNSSQPVGFKNAGCIFKNPEGRSAGQLVDEAGLKGTRIGGASVSDLHGNYIVNEGGSFKDITALIEKVTQSVSERFNITLEREIEVWP